MIDSLGFSIIKGFEQEAKKVGPSIVNFRKPLKVLNGWEMQSGL